MSTRKKTKLIREGRYAAEVEVELIDDETGWAPYLSVDDASRLDSVRADLRADRIDQASQQARVFELLPLPRRETA